jgi:hypothetical protein
MGIFEMASNKLFDKTPPIYQKFYFILHPTNKEGRIHG